MIRLPSDVLLRQYPTTSGNELDFLRYVYDIDYDSYYDCHGINFNAVRLSDGKLVVIKISEMGPTHREGNGGEIPMEIAVNIHLKGSSFTTKMLEFFIFKEYYIIIMERARHTVGLKVFIRAIDSLAEVEVCYFQKMIIRIIAELRDYGLQHRGLSLGDFKFDLHRATLKICDLTNVRFSTDSFLYLGDGVYSPPECADNMSVDYDSFMSWSLGIIFYMQFVKSKPDDLMTEIISGNFNLNLSEEAAKYISKSLAIEPRRRISLDEHVNYEWLHSNFYIFKQISPEEELSYTKCENMPEETCFVCQILEEFI